jgi:hypothetical protein
MRQFRLQPRPTGVDLRITGFLVDPALAALFKFELLDCVGEVGVVAIDAGIPGRALEQAARGSKERGPGESYAIAGLSANQDDACRSPAFAGNSSSGATVQIAATAVLDGFAQLRKGGMGRDEFGGTRIFGHV